ncbi:MAG: class I SAM-dependent methyltransferase [Polyangiaceae bacterium]|nr:class I SAM-dependent methyltransferase [Polyangiaceae bacterium]
MTLVRLGSGWQPLVRRVLAALGAEPLARAESVSALAELLDQVVTWNLRVNLTSARSPEELVDLYVADAAVMALHSPRSAATWVDVGSGAGAPGLSLALLSPGLSVTLVEPRAKRWRSCVLRRSRSSAIEPAWCARGASSCPRAAGRWPCRARRCLPQNGSSRARGSGSAGSGYYSAAQRRQVTPVGVWRLT